MIHALRAALVGSILASLPNLAAATGDEAGWLTVGADTAGQASSYDGVVEAVRQASLSVQVAGAITELAVKAGDTVKAGQVLMRIDAQAAVQGSAASDAQVAAAQAAADMARTDHARQQRLFDKGYVSQAALDRSEAQFKASQAQLAAQQSAAAAVHTQAGYFVLRAPWPGVVSEVPVARGDLALPGKPLATLYDPAALRVTVAVPQAALPGLRAPAATEVEIPGAAGTPARIRPATSRVMPVVDAATHTAELRLDLPAHLAGVAPGMFARAWLPGAAGSPGAHLWVPSSAVVQRSELTAVYARDGNGHALLRQVHIGQSAGGRTEVLSGIGVGDAILADPSHAGAPAAARP